jgi:hypothetical protein
MNGHNGCDDTRFASFPWGYSGGDPGGPRIIEWLGVVGMWPAPPNQVTSGCASTGLLEENAGRLGTGGCAAWWGYTPEYEG